MDIYKKIKAGEVISDSDFAACNETPLDIFRFFEKALKDTRNKAKKYLADYFEEVKKREKLENIIETLESCDKTLIYKKARDNFEVLNRYKQTVNTIEKIAQKNDELLQCYHLERANNQLILEIIEELKGGK